MHGFFQSRRDVFHGVIVPDHRGLQRVEAILDAVAAGQVLKDPLALLAGRGGGDGKGRPRQLNPLQDPQEGAGLRGKPLAGRGVEGPLDPLLVSAE